MPSRRFRLIAVCAAALCSAVPPAWAAPKFQSVEDYARACAVAQPGKDCQDAFVEANGWVRFNSDVALCLPDQKLPFGSREFSAAMSEEISGLTGWLKQHPEAVKLDYVQSLGAALIGLYACK